jgi:glycosyltransferase involved in cell wall biosynthesis
MGHPARSFSLFAPTPSDAVSRHRIVQVITPSRYSGAERVLARLVPRLEARGHALHSVCSRHSPAIAEFRMAGLAIEPAAIGGKANLLAPHVLQRVAQRYRTDFFHTHLSSASWWAGWLEKFGGTPSLGHVHGFTSAIWHRSQKHLVAVSQAVKMHLVEQGIQADRITVIHNAVDPTDIQPQRLPARVREELGAGPKTPVIGCFAHLSPKKGWADLFRAIPIVLRSFPQAQFWCVGAGPLRETLLAEADREGFVQQLRMTGFRRDVADLMRAVDVVVLPSHREPLGLVYIEAGLLCRPVIGCTTGGAPEVIEHNENGLLVPPKAPQALAAAMMTLLDNRRNAEALGRRGRERACSDYSWPGYLDQLETVYARFA